MKRPWLIVAKQTYRIRIKSLSYWMLVLSPLLLAAFSIGIGIFFSSASSSQDKATLAIVQQPQLTQTLKQSKALDVKLTDVTTVATAKKQLKQADIDGYLVKNNTDYQLVTSATGSSTINQATLTTVLTQFKMAATAQSLNISADKLQALTAPVNLKVQQMDHENKTTKGDNSQANSTLSISIGVLFFIILLFYVQIIAQEIANEKSSRIMEILLAATSAASQFYGKIAGVFALALTQMLLYVVVGGAAINIFSDNRILKSAKAIFSNISWQFAAVTIVMLLLAIVMYLTLAAIIASLVNDQSQVQQAVQPVSYLTMIGYILSFIVANAPHNVIINIASYIPFISQTLIPSRLALNFVSYPQAIIAIILQVIVVILILMFGLKIYQRNVLEYSDESIYKQLRQLMHRKS